MKKILFLICAFFVTIAYGVDKTYKASSGDLILDASDDVVVNTLLGIGINEPEEEIHISGSLSRIRLDSSLSENWQLGADSSPAGFHITNMTDTAIRMILDNDGDIGFGETNPTGAATKVLAIKDENPVGLVLEKTGTNARKWEILTNSSGQLGVYDNNAAVYTMLIQDDGYGSVSFGGVSPAANTMLTLGSTNTWSRLYLMGEATGDKAQITLNHYGYGDHHIEQGIVGNGLFSISHTSGGLGFVMDMNDNVGFGLTAPHEKVEVVGAIVSDQSEAADYNMGLFGVHETASFSLVNNGYKAFTINDNTTYKFTALVVLHNNNTGYGCAMLVTNGAVYQISDPVNYCVDTAEGDPGYPTTTVRFSINGNNQLVVQNKSASTYEYYMTILATRIDTP